MQNSYSELNEAIRSAVLNLTNTAKIAGNNLIKGIKQMQNKDILIKGWKLVIANGREIKPDEVRLYPDSKLVVCSYKTSQKPNFYKNTNQAILNLTNN